jgi:ATP-dependent RNA helicase DDX24/MAK5
MTLSKEAKLSLKRKLKPSALPARKKLKVDGGRSSRKTVAQIGDLPWKSVARPMDTGMGGDDGILELEEVDDVEVYYEETDGGRVAKFKVGLSTV